MRVRVTVDLTPLQAAIFTWARHEPWKSQGFTDDQLKRQLQKIHPGEGSNFRSRRAELARLGLLVRLTHYRPYKWIIAESGWRVL